MIRSQCRQQENQLQMSSFYLYFCDKTKFYTYELRFTVVVLGKYLLSLDPNNSQIHINKLKFRHIPINGQLVLKA